MYHQSIEQTTDLLFVLQSGLPELRAEVKRNQGDERRAATDPRIHADIEAVISRPHDKAEDHTFRAPSLPKADPLARSRQRTSVYRSYTDGRI